MVTMTTKQKVLGGALLVLAAGLAVGYGAGIVTDRAELYGQRNGMMRGGFGLGYAENQRGDGYGYGGRGGYDRDGDRGQGDGYGMMNGSGRGFGMMGGGFGRGGGVDRGSCLSDECLLVNDLEYPVGSLSDAAKSALTSALNDEYKALSTYEAVVARNGSVRPFIKIARAEERHIAELKSLFDKYGVVIPENPYVGKIAVPETKQAACQAGYDAETANAALYRNTLLPSVTEYPDISAVFTNLMNASQNRHLPAFDRCK